VIQENLIVDRPVYLKGGLGPLSSELGGSRLRAEIAVRDELEIPKVVRLSPPVRGADLHGKASFLDLIPYSHLGKDVRNGRELAFADMVPRKFVPLKDQNLK
jgi:hypothetical protein